jgi:hypothetical protein
VISSSGDIRPRTVLGDPMRGVVGRSGCPGGRISMT